jgi:hypothetical protein
VTKVAIEVLRADSSPWPHAQVAVRLITAGAGGASGPGVIVGTQRFTCDEQGAVEVDLTPNGDITPAGTFYALAVVGASPAVTRLLEVPEPSIMNGDEVPVSWADPAIQVLSDDPPVYLPAPSLGTEGFVPTVDGTGTRFVLAPQTGGGGGGGIAGVTAPITEDEGVIGLAIGEGLAVEDGELVNTGVPGPPGEAGEMSATASVPFGIGGILDFRKLDEGPVAGETGVSVTNGDGVFDGIVALTSTHVFSLETNQPATVVERDGVKAWELMSGEGVPDRAGLFVTGPYVQVGEDQSPSPLVVPDDVAWAIGFTHGGYVNATDPDDLHTGDDTAIARQNTSFLSFDGNGYTLEVLAEWVPSESAVRYRVQVARRLGLTVDETLIGYNLPRKPAFGDRFDLAGWWDGTTMRLSAYVNGRRVGSASDDTYATSTLEMVINFLTVDDPHFAAPGTWRPRELVAWSGRPWRVLTADAITYDPADGDDWDEGAPSEVAEALDTLAAREMPTIPPQPIVRSGGVVTKTNSDVPTASTTFSFAGEANTPYAVRLDLLATAPSATPDLCVGFSAPSDATVEGHVIGAQTSASSSEAQIRNMGRLLAPTAVGGSPPATWSTNSFVAVGVVTAGLPVHVYAVIGIDATPGTVSLCLSQNTSSGDAVTVAGVMTVTQPVGLTTENQ